MDFDVTAKIWNICDGKKKEGREGGKEEGGRKGKAKKEKEMK